VDLEISVTNTSLRKNLNLIIVDYIDQMLTLHYFIHLIWRFLFIILFYKTLHAYSAPPHTHT